MGKRTLKRRRREGRTDYRLRLGLLKSGLPRIVIRRTNKYFIVQVVDSVEAQDRVVSTVSSKELIKNGWDSAGGAGDGQQVTGDRTNGSTKKKRIGNLKSIPAGYLTGLLAAKKIKKGNYIVDLGMARTIAGARVFAVVKGLIDGGVGIEADEKVFPVEDRLMGEHCNLKDMVVKAKEGLK